MMKGKNITLFAAFLLPVLLWCTDGFGQQAVAKKYPAGYFRNPLSIPISLSSNFGELRSTHWHMGLDLRTNQKENYPVFAAADGYVAYAGVRPLSFGKFLVIHHPNGLSTLYAHLNAFYPELEKRIRERQLSKESWAVEMEFRENELQVKKSDTIGKSGNTGGSQGPHLHFEIRDTETGNSLNPLLFGFDVKDEVPPVITRLALYNRHTSTFHQSPQMIPVKKTDSGYYTHPQKIMLPYCKLSFAVGAYDRVSGSRGNDGIYSALFYLDDKPQVEFVLDNFDYNESAYINAHIDYRHDRNGGPKLQHLSKLPGIRSGIYHEIESDGTIFLNDTLEHHVRIEVMDAYDNLSVLFFTIQYSDSLALLQAAEKKMAGYKMIPGSENLFRGKDFEARLPADALYDTLYALYYRQNLFLPAAVSAQHRLHEPSVPVHSYINVRLKPVIPVPDGQKDKIVMQWEWQGNKSVKKAQWEGEWMTARFGNFGNFQAFVDLDPPDLKPPWKEADTVDLSRADKIVFTPQDNFGIKSFRAELNGEWLMFSNDKGRDWVYFFDEQCPYGVHELTVKAWDIAGNITEKKWWFLRNEKPVPLKKKPVSKKSTKKK